LPVGCPHCGGALTLDRQRVKPWRLVAVVRCRSCDAEHALAVDLAPITHRPDFDPLSPSAIRARNLRARRRQELNA